LKGRAEKRREGEEERVGEEEEENEREGTKQWLKLLRKADGGALLLQG